MKSSHWIRAAVLVAIGFQATMGATLRAAQPGAPEVVTQNAPVVDVELEAGGILRGQVVDGQGAPQAGAGVAALQAGKLVAVAQADEQGWFALENLRGGIYQIETENSANMYRAWAADTAPPSAQPQALLVSDEQLVRGQGPVRRILTNPWFWGIGIACAIAIPLALATDGKDKPKGS